MNTYEFLVIVIAGLALIVSAISIIISWNNNRITLRMSLFSEYTKRYQEIEIGLLNEDNNTRTKYYRLYIDLCSEEYYLNKKKCLDNDVWEMWQDGMRLIVKVQDLRIVWRACSQHYNDDFCKFFNNMIKDSQIDSKTNLK